MVRGVHRRCSMNALPLTARESGELEALLRTPAGRECCRAQALLWLSQGMPVEAIADLLGVTRQTVYNWANRFQQREGLALYDRLTDGPRSGRPPAGAGLLDLCLEAAFDQAPTDIGFRGTAWTAPLLCQYLRQVHQIEVSRKTVSRALDRLDLRWKRPRHQLALRPKTWRQSKGGSRRALWTACARCS
jgi:transposase